MNNLSQELTKTEVITKHNSRKNTVVLFYPKLIPSACNKNEAHFTPLGLLSVAGPLVQSGYNVVIIDSSIGERWEDKNIDTDDVICFGIGSMSGYQLRDGLNFSRFIKDIKCLPVPIIWGGDHVSLSPEQSINNPYVDIVVIDQGEESLLEVVNHLSSGEPLDGIKGILYKKDGQVYKNNPRPLADPNKFPSVPYELINISSYLDEAKTKNLRMSDAFPASTSKFLYYCSSVGCPYRCRFCSTSNLSNRKWIGLKSERVIEDIVRLVGRYDINCVQFCDPEFFISSKRAKEIAQGFIDNKLNIQWKANLRANTLSKFDDDMLVVLKKSGYVHIEIGVESGSQRMLDYINKDITVEQIMKCAEIIVKHNIHSSFFLVFGFPMETKADIKASFKVASKLKEMLPDCLLPVYFYNPYPGTPLYREALQLGMKPPKSMEEWADIKLDIREPSPLTPWLTKRYMDYVHRVIIFYLPLAFPANIGIGTLTHIKTKLKNSKIRWIIWVAHKLAKWRVKHQFFVMPFEWIMFKAYRAFSNWVLSRIKPKICNLNLLHKR